ncbi:metallophosphoesterase [Lachnospiraceae bacterium WCA-9-b2]|uniref:Metallophosphoesterase n=2 Tax=Sporofaciens musculi TaxID=2681861 RepID=A0A7X3MHD4_9FIRM|nr:metallophosphoesterase [Sporofaciens musculi]MXP76387.1 metallophosphoesterase [Sporofaciens musculi]
MLAILLSPLYVLVNAYIIRWIIRWLSTCRHEFRRFRSRLIVSMVYLFFASAMGVGFFLPSGGVKRFFVKIGNYWLGVLLYTILVVGAADVIHVLLKRSKKINQEKLRSFKVFVASGIICAVGIAVLSIWGMVNAGNIRTTKYEAVIDKKAGNLKQMKVVMAADLHMGYNIGCEHIQKMVEKINAQEPDLVVFAGDIFDNEYEALEDPKKLIDILKGIKSKYGVYACYGNHDIKEKILAGFTFGGSQKKESDIRMDEFLKEAGITLLRDESVLIGDSVYLYGRPDRQRPGRDIKTRKTPEEITAGMDLSKPVFVIDHQPKELQELADAGVDLDLCGHTHDGQVWPGNLTIRLMWENACGYLKKGDMHNIVTSGVGIFGPNMRVGTIAEICSVTVKFKGDE